MKDIYKVSLTLSKNTDIYKVLLTLSKNTSLLVIFLTAVNVSCTIPITGLLDCGVMIILDTRAKFEISAFVSKDWGRCKFISSPSKSALYGVVTLQQNIQIKL